MRLSRWGAKCLNIAIIIYSVFTYLVVSMLQGLTVQKSILVFLSIFVFFIGLE